MATGYHKGREIECKDGVAWRYCDTGEIVDGNGRVNQFCKRCGRPPTTEDHDACLGTLDESIVMNACCGHGEDEWAYVQFWNGTDLQGSEAIDYIRKLKEVRRVEFDTSLYTEVEMLVKRDPRTSNLVRTKAGERYLKERK